MTSQPATAIVTTWLNSRLYRIIDDSVEVQAQRGATLYWTKIAEGPLTVRIKTRVAKDKVAA